MKSIFKPLLSLSFSLLLVGACAPQDSQVDKTGGDLSILSNGPNLPEACNPCWDDFQDCFAGGNGLEQCAQDIVACVDACDAPPPPPECLHCAAGFEACATTAQSNGQGADDCAVGFEGCLSACEFESMCDQNADLCEPEPQPDDCSSCEQGFDECINDSWQGGQNDGSTADCEGAWGQCLDGCGQGDPSDGAELCQQALDQCQNDPDGTINLPDGEVSCADVIDACLGQDPGGQPDLSCDLCMAALDQCGQEGGVDNCGELQQHCAELCQ